MRYWKIWSPRLYNQILGWHTNMSARKAEKPAQSLLMPLSWSPARNIPNSSTEIFTEFLLLQAFLRRKWQFKQIGVRFSALRAIGKSTGLFLFSASLSKAPLELSSHTFHEQAHCHINKKGTSTTGLVLLIMLQFWSLCNWVLDEPIQGNSSSAICVCTLWKKFL